MVLDLRLDQFSAGLKKQAEAAARSSNA